MISKECFQDVEEDILAHFETISNVDYKNIKITQSSVREYLQDHRQRFNKICNIVERIAPDSCNILIVGVAYGADALVLQSLGYKVYGTELPDNIQAYSSHLMGSGITVFPWDMHKEECSIPKNKFDVIIASEVFEHLYISLNSAVHKTTDLLKDGGYLIVTTPNIYKLTNLIQICKNNNINESFPDTPVIRNDIVVDWRTHPREPCMGELEKAYLGNRLKIIQKTYFNPYELSTWITIAFNILPRRIRSNLLIVGKK